MIESFTESWDREWIGKEVVLRLSFGDTFRGKLCDFGKYYARVNIGSREMFANPEHIVSIVVVG